MKKALFILIAATCIMTHTAYAHVDIDQLAAEKLNWIDNASARQSVISHAKSGRPQIEFNSPECTHEFPDTIGVGDFQYCVEVAALPNDVSKELADMEASRFDNISDYDQRITKFVAVRHNGLIFDRVSNDIEALSGMINIEAGMVQRVRFSTPTLGSMAYLFPLRGLSVDETVSDKSMAYHFVDNLDAGQPFLHVGFSLDEIGLFPGGGYTTSFTFFINKNWLIYAKSEGWNS